jgi:hypothetical protein
MVKDGNPFFEVFFATGRQYILPSGRPTVPHVPPGGDATVAFELPERSIKRGYFNLSIRQRIPA